MPRPSWLERWFPTTAGKSQAELLQMQFARQERTFRLHVALSWGVLLALLAFVFSGVRLQIGEWTLLKTIRLDQEFLLAQVRCTANLLQLRATFPFMVFEDQIACVTGGVFQTIEISILSIFFATLLALLAALGRLSRVPPVYALATFYVSLIRGTPLFLQIMFFFLALPQLGIQLPPFWAGILPLSINYGAYMSEIFRAGILSVSKGQREAATALGMTYPQLMRRIVLPQALRFAIPPTGNEFIAMLKDSALVSATGFVHEILWRATKIGRANFRNLEALIVAALFYWVMTMLFTTLQDRLEKYMARGDR